MATLRHSSDPGVPRKGMRFNSGLGLWCLCCALSVVTFTGSGCAVHYGNSARGIDRAWGLGEVTWELRAVTNDVVAVSSGFRLSGIVVGVGPDFFGLTLGYQARERLQVLPAVGRTNCSASVNGVAFASAPDRRWALGRMALRTPPQSAVAVISGRAAAGVGLGLERGRPTVGAGWQATQLTEVAGDDVRLEFTLPAGPWPHQDFPSTQVGVALATNEISTPDPP